MIQNYLRVSTFLLVLYLFLLAFMGRFIRETDLDYIISILIVSWSGIAFISFKWSKYDLAWAPSLLVAIVYLVIYLFEVVHQFNPIIQCLIFFIPVVSLLTRYVEIDSNQFTNLIFLLSVTCLLGFIPFFDEVITALTSSYERSRFHTFFSIAICFPIVSILIAGLVGSKRKLYFLIFVLVVFSGSAAHRSLYLAFLVQFIYWAYINGNGKSLIRPLIGCLFGGVLLLMTDFGGVILQKFFDSAAGYDGNTESRLFYYGEIFRHSFEEFLGIGFGEYFRYGRDSKGELVPYALQHNSYLSYLYFVGWPSFLLVIFWKAKLYLSVINYDDVLVKVVATSLVGMSFFSILNVYLEQPIFGFSYWVLFGVLIGLVTRKTASIKFGDQ